MIFVPRNETENAQIAEWVRRRIPRASFQPPYAEQQLYQSLGFVQGNKILGAVVFYNYQAKRDVEIAVASDDPRWVTPGTIRRLAKYVFGTLQCVRVTARVNRRNRRSRIILRRLGFLEEGKLRKAAATGDDLMVYGLLRDDYNDGRNARRTGKSGSPGSCQRAAG